MLIDEHASYIVLKIYFQTLYVQHNTEWCYLTSLTANLLQVFIHVSCSVMGEPVVAVVIVGLFGPSVVIVCENDRKYNY